MTEEFKIKSLDDLEKEMRAVARGEIPAPKDAAKPSFNSIEALVRILTPENRELLSVIRDKNPQSIADLERLTGRASPNLLRTLTKLETVGLVSLRTEGKRTIPTALAGTFHVEIDPYTMNDRVQVSEKTPTGDRILVG